MTVAGIVRQSTDHGYYSLILEEAGGTRKLKIVIGANEAHSIECVLRHIVPPRPLTHDLLADVIQQFGIRAEGVVIELLPGNVYGAHIMLTDGTQKKSLDARSSDAVALAVRLNIPLYASVDLLQSEGIGSKQQAPAAENTRHAATAIYDSQIDLTGIADEQLRVQMQEAAAAERYELASIIKAELDRRKNDIKE